MLLLLLLLIPAVPAEIVPPSTNNVNVRCQNLQTTVSWSYSQQEPRPRFRVNLEGSAGEYEDETTDHQYDLSRFIWESERNYMDFHYVTVTALLGGYQSKPVRSKTFTYNTLKTADITCEVDFPPVDLTVEDGRTTVSFKNPFHFYEKLKRAKKLGTRTFKFTVSYNASEFVCDCSEENDICKQDIPKREGVKMCVRLKGVLFEANGVGQVLFRQTEQICTSESSDVHVMVFLIMVAIFVVIIIALTLIVCKVKAFILKTEKVPNPLVFPEKSELLNPRVPGNDMVPERDISRVIVHESNKSSSASLEEEEEVPTSIHDPYKSRQDKNSTGSDLHPPDGCMYMENGALESSNQDLGAAGSGSEGLGTDDDSVETECVSFVSEEEKSSPYDCPHTHIDMGGGDIVECYNK